MPRFARLEAPGTLVHVISRFVNGEFRIPDDPGLRNEYLDRVGQYVARTDWIWLSYGLMSSHTHNAAIVGYDPLWHWVHPLHSWLAGAINRLDGRCGPVFRERPTTVYMPRKAAARLVPYIHNNPCRAGLATIPSESGPDWTSHRAYQGRVLPPANLDVKLGLELCGFDCYAEGRAAFDAMVDSRRGDRRDPELSDEDAADSRAALRRALGAPVEVSAPFVTDDGPCRQIIDAPQTPLRPQRDVRPSEVLEAVCAHTELPLESVTERSKKPRCVEARRLALLAWRKLGRPATELCRALGISSATASHLMNRRPDFVEMLDPAARAIAARCASTSPLEQGAVLAPVERGKGLSRK